MGYELDESLNWAVSRDELERKLAGAKEKGLEVRAMALINPGNPSGNVMTHCGTYLISNSVDSWRTGIGDPLTQYIMDRHSSSDRVLFRSWHCSIG